MGAGRPTDYNQDLSDKICERIADGESLRTICSDDDMPNKATVFRWLAKFPAFSDQYARARDTQAETIVDEILNIADDGTNDWMERRNGDGENIGWQENGEALRRSVLRIDARKWMAGKLKPKKYGDKVQHTGADGEGPVQIEDKGAYDMARRVALLLAGANDKPA